MRVGDVIAEIMKRERINVRLVCPLTPLTEYAAAADIRPIVVRQERVGCAMADAGGHLSSRTVLHRAGVPVPSVGDSAGECAEL
jgi:thiamine pyrophosphate-dependent acetolactate synthase large subunit-like protein